MPRHACGAPDDIYLHGAASTIIIISSHRRITNRAVTFRWRIFWAFDVLPAVKGSSIDSTKTISRGITHEPAPFQFRVCARHPEVERIIESESAGADIRLKEWEY